VPLLGAQPDERLRAMGDPLRPGGPSGPGPVDARLQLLVAEYTWVTGLIRYYREVELKALFGTGLVLSGVGAAFAALRASDNPDAADAIGLVFAIAASITAFVLPVVVMANMRGMRAVVYVREWLHPLSAELAQDARFLAWEAVTRELYDALAGRLGVLMKPMLSAAVVVCLIGATSLALAAAAFFVEHSTSSRAIGGAAAVCDLIFICAALRFASRSELGHSLSTEDRTKLVKTASNVAGLSNANVPEREPAKR
jgi:hypothetical protein